MIRIMMQIAVVPARKTLSVTLMCLRSKLTERKLRYTKYQIKNRTPKMNKPKVASVVYTVPRCVILNAHEILEFCSSEELICRRLLQVRI